LRDVDSSSAAEALGSNHRLLQEPLTTRRYLNIGVPGPLCYIGAELVIHMSPGILPLDELLPNTFLVDGVVSLGIPIHIVADIFE
jgi:hypothetical protein